MPPLKPSAQLGKPSHIPYLGHVRFKRPACIHVNWCELAQVKEEADCLLEHADFFTEVHLSGEFLSGEDGLKFAQFVATSTTIRTVFLEFNRIDISVFFAFAAALHFTTSLNDLRLCGIPAPYVFDDSESQKIHPVDAAFINSIRVNQHLHELSYLAIIRSQSNHIDWYKKMANQWGHPTLQQLLCTILDTYNRHTTPKIREI